MNNDSHRPVLRVQAVQDSQVWQKALRWLIQDQTLILIVSFAAILAANAGIDVLVIVVLWALLAYFILGRQQPQPSNVSLTDKVDNPQVDPVSGIYAAFTALDMPVFVLDSSAAVLFQNDPAIHVFGEFPEQAHISAKLRSPGLLDMVYDTIGTSIPNQIEHAERVPSEQIFQARIAPLVVPRGGDDLSKANDPLYILSFRDISETRRIDRMRSDFVANASHELRTPLASVRGFIETLQGPAKDDPKVHERFLNIMLEQVTRMTRMVDDLLSLSRLELKAQITPTDRVELGALLGHVRDALMPLANDLGLTITLHVPDTGVVVPGDQDELTEVFENLMENACKYGQEGKRVDVVLINEPGKPVEVTVRDFGPGIPEEHLPRITERFYRVNVEASRSKKGTGLGLAIVKHILTRHRARLIVKSELGKGTSFTVRF